jgi:hypothetical protein
VTAARGREATREARRRDLERVPKAALVAMCAVGITRPDGGRTIIQGGMHPLADWRKDEIVGAVINVEFPPDDMPGIRPEIRSDL